MFHAATSDKTCDRRALRRLQSFAQISWSWHTTFDF